MAQNVMLGRVKDTYVKNGQDKFIVELYDLSDREKELLTTYMTAVAKRMYLRSRKEESVEEFTKKYIAEHTTENGITIATSDISVYGAYRWEKNEGVIACPDSEIPHDDTDEEIKAARDQVINELRRKKFADKGIGGRIDISKLI